MKFFHVTFDGFWGFSLIDVYEIEGVPPEAKFPNGNKGKRIPCSH
jgi:hypothetical protein